jgi:bacteriocin-like protein
MSKTNDDNTKTRELTEDELTAVSGGWRVYQYIGGDDAYKAAAAEAYGNYKASQAEGYGN